MIESLSEFLKVKNHWRFFTLYDYLKTHFSETSIRVLPKVSLQCSLNEVEEVIMEKHHISIFVNLQSLYGVTSPLPGYLIHLLALDTRESIRLRDFFNWMSGHFYELAYEVWKMQHTKKNRLQPLNPLIDLHKFRLDLCIDVTFKWIYFWQNLPKELHNEKQQLGNNILLGHKALVKSHKILLDFHEIHKHQVREVYDYCREKSYGKNLLLKFHCQESTKIILGETTTPLGSWYGVPQVCLYPRR